MITKLTIETINYALSLSKYATIDESCDSKIITVTCPYTENTNGTITFNWLKCDQDVGRIFIHKERGDVYTNIYVKSLDEFKITLDTLAITRKV